MIIMNDTQKKIRDELSKIQSSKIANKTDAQLAAEENWKNDSDLQNRRVNALKENTDKISESSKRNWKNKEYREKRKKSLAAANMRPEVKAKRKESAARIHADPTWIENHRKGLEELRNDPKRWADYRKKYLKGNRAKYDSPEFWENYYNAIAKRDADPEYHKRRIAASNAKISIKVVTPAGAFDSISDAARHYGMTSEGMRHRVNSDKYPEFYKTGDVAKKPQKKKK